MDTWATAWVESQGLTTTCLDSPVGAVLSETITTVSLNTAPGPSQLSGRFWSHQNHKFPVEPVMSCKIILSLSGFLTVRNWNQVVGIWPEPVTTGYPVHP